MTGFTPGTGPPAIAGSRRWLGAVVRAAAPVLGALGAAALRSRPQRPGTRRLAFIWLLVLAACTDSGSAISPSHEGPHPVDDGGRAAEEQLAAVNEVLTEALTRLPGGPVDPKVSLSYDDRRRPSHNYFFFSGELKRELGFRGLEFDIHVDPRDAVLIAVVDADLPTAEKLTAAGYTSWYKDNWSGYPAFHEPTDIRHDRYHVAVYRCARPLRPSPAIVDEVVEAVLRFAREWKALS